VKAKTRTASYRYKIRLNGWPFDLSELFRIDISVQLIVLVYFPLLRDGIVLPTHEKFNAPDHKGKKRYSSTATTLATSDPGAGGVYRQ